MIIYYHKYLKKIEWDGIVNKHYFAGTPFNVCYSYEEENIENKNLLDLKIFQKTNNFKETPVSPSGSCRIASAKFEILVWCHKTLTERFENVC